MSEAVKRYRVPEGVLHAEIDGEEVLLNPDTGIYHLVNRTGRDLLIQMEAGDSLEAAVGSIAASSGQDVGRVHQDAAEFVMAMTERGLLEVAAD